ncbi:hypothetical protein WMF30_32290 [Sorangium sp. So ce134]
MNPQELLQLERQLARIPPDDRADVLLAPFADPPAEAFLAQQYAGALLLKLRPPCSGPLAELLRRVLPRWNPSVEQLPWYLAGCFGRDAVIACLDALDESGEVNRSLIASARFWMTPIRP